MEKTFLFRWNVRCYLVCWLGFDPRWLQKCSLWVINVSMCHSCLVCSSLWKLWLWSGHELPNVCILSSELGVSHTRVYDDCSHVSGPLGYRKTILLSCHASFRDVGTFGTNSYGLWTAWCRLDLSQALLLYTWLILGLIAPGVQAIVLEDAGEPYPTPTGLIQIMLRIIHWQVWIWNTQMQGGSPLGSTAYVPMTLRNTVLIVTELELQDTVGTLLEFHRVSANYPAVVAWQSPAWSRGIQLGPSTSHKLVHLTPGVDCYISRSHSLRIAGHMGDCVQGAVGAWEWASSTLWWEL